MPVYLIMLAISAVLLGIGGLLSVGGNEDVAAILVLLGILGIVASIYDILTHPDVFFDTMMSLATS